MPLLPEVAAILDWACTSTTLLIGEWVKVNDIYSTIYLSEVSFEFYIRMKREKGEPHKTWRKWVQGGLISLLLFAVLIFPLLVFSDLNPSNEKSALMEVSIEIGISEFEPLYTHQADVSLGYLPNGGSSATCPYVFFIFLSLFLFSFLSSPRLSFSLSDTHTQIHTKTYINQITDTPKI
jgi:hypothetical protein